VAGGQVGGEFGSDSNTRGTEVAAHDQVAESSTAITVHDQVDEVTGLYSTVVLDREAAWFGRQGPAPVGAFDHMRRVRKSHLCQYRKSRRWYSCRQGAS